MKKRYFCDSAIDLQMTLILDIHWNEIVHDDFTRIGSFFTCGKVWQTSSKSDKTRKVAPMSSAWTV